MPLDVQLLKQNEIGERKSGLVVRTAFDGLSDECWQLYDKIMYSIKSQGGTISYDRASTIATQIVTGVLAPVYSQINPDVLGSDLRNLRVATEYGNRLANYGKNANFDTVSKLVSDYPSHDFIIDAAEARTLFQFVPPPTPAMGHLVLKIGAPAFSEQAQHIVYRADLLPLQSTNQDPAHDQSKASTQPEAESRDRGAGLDAARGGNRTSNGTTAAAATGDGRKTRKTKSSKQKSSEL